jgi:drug/metabolite transporter (DMT)-like permease
MAVSPFLVVPLVLLSAVLHATWNALVKTGNDRLMALTVVTATSTVWGFAVIPFVPLPAPASWPFIAMSVIAHSGYYIFLLLAYRHGDLSHVYPLARGTAPLLVALSATVVAGEMLALGQWAGVLLVSVGIASLALDRGLPRGREGKAVRYAIMTGLCISSYTVIDGLGVRLSGHALAYISWMFAIEGLPLVAAAFLTRADRIRALSRPDWVRSVGGGLIATVGYAIAIWAMSVAGLAQITALRETSVIFGAAIGALILGERFGGRRIAAAALVAAGNLMLHLMR